jgi:hypothetical protein
MDREPLLFPTETVPMATPKGVQKKNSRSRFWAFIIVIVIAFSLLLFLRTSTTSSTAGHTCGPHTELIGNECVGEDTTALIAAKEAAVTDKLAAIADKEAAATAKEAAITDKLAAIADKEAAEAAKEAAIAAKEAAVTDKLAAIADKEAAEAVKEATLAVIDVAIADKEAAIATSTTHLNDKESAATARDAAQAARDAAIAEKDAAIAAKDAAEVAKSTALITKAAAEDARNAAIAAKDAAIAARDECLNNGYQPCQDKSAGDVCLICAPNDSQCAETMLVKQCASMPGGTDLICSPLSSGDNGGVAFDISTHGTIGAVCDYIDDNVGGYQCTSMDLILEEGSILTGQAAKDACDTIAAKITAITAADETMPDWIANECKAGHAEEDFSKCMCVVQWSDWHSSDPDGALYTGALFDSVTNFNAGSGIPHNCNNWQARGLHRSCVTTTP